MQFCCVAAQSQPRSQYDIRVSDPKNSLGLDLEPVLQNLRAALDDWTRYIPGMPSLQIEVRVLDKTASGRFGGRAEKAVWLDLQWAESFGRVHNP